MKRSFLFILPLSILFLVGLAGYKVNDKKIINIPIQTDQAYLPSGIDDLETGADAIVRAKVLPGAENVIITPETAHYVYGATYTEIEVLEVFSGEIQTDDILTITEEYFTVETATEIQIHYTENYCPSTPEAEYIFFLKKYAPQSKYAGMYYPLGVDRGRYPVLNELSPSFSSPIERRSRIPNIDGFTNAELNLGEGDSTVYREIFEDVIAKYY